jgi:hypothetical protein
MPGQPCRKPAVRRWTIILTRVYSEPRALLAGLGLGAVFSTWNLIAMRLNPFADDSPAALLMFYGPMFTAWGVVGFVATRRTMRLSSGVKAAAAVAFVTFVFFTAAVIIRVNLSLETVNHRPDWQNLVARFRGSGSQSLRAYVNYEYLTGAPFKILVASAIGSFVGFVGGCCALATGKSARC